MCLGAQAKAANEAMMRDYEYKLEKRERNWMQTLSLTNVQHIQHEQGIDASNLGLANIYSDIQEKHGELVDQVFQANEADWKDFLEKSKGADMKAAGRLGRSSDRISALELGNYMKNAQRRANQLTKAAKGLSKEGAQADRRVRAQQLQSFANVAFIKNPDMAPPKPVLQNVGMASFMDALSIGSSIASIASGLGPGGAGLWEN